MGQKLTNYNETNWNKKNLSYLFQGENVGIGWGIGSPMVKLQFN